MSTTAREQIVPLGTEGKRVARVHVTASGMLCIDIQAAGAEAGEVQCSVSIEDAGVLRIAGHDGDGSWAGSFEVGDNGRMLAIQADAGCQ